MENKLIMFGSMTPMMRARELLRRHGHILLLLISYITCHLLLHHVHVLSEGHLLDSQIRTQLVLFHL